MKRIIVAIDGHSGCGKSTIARQLAQYAGYRYIDTGAMYRAVALYAIEHNLETEEQIVAALPAVQIGFERLPDGSQHTLLNGTDVENRIRTLEVGNRASQVSTIRQVRLFLVEQQQAMGLQKGIVMDGRDIGTVVFPNAELKLFVTASPEVRARRRLAELQAKGENPDFEVVLRDVTERDRRDSSRAESPLKQASDAVLLDNSNMTREQQADRVFRLFDDRIR